MSSARSIRRIRLASLASAALAVTGLPLLASPAADANAAGTDLVIREVYPGGGSTNVTASYKTDFVELYNPTDNPRSLDGLSLQYRNSDFGGNPANVVVLALPDEVVPANDSYLVETSPTDATFGGADLPTPDFSSTAIPMGLTNGQLMLAVGVDPIAAVGTTMHTVTGVVDFVGWGDATSSETRRRPHDRHQYLHLEVGRRRGHRQQQRRLHGRHAEPAGGYGDTTPAPLVASDPGDRTGQVGSPITAFDLQATGGVAPYTWAAVGLPPGVTVSPSGHVAGTPTAAGVFPVTCNGHGRGPADARHRPNAVHLHDLGRPAAPAVKADSTTVGKVKPKRPEPGQKVILKVKVTAENGAAVTGRVKVKVGTKKKTATLEDGRAKVKLGRFGKGRHTVKVVYLGSATVERSKDTVRFRVA